MTLNGRAQKATVDRQAASLKKNAGKTSLGLENPLAANEASWPSSAGKRWTSQEIYELKLMAQINTPVEIIACELQRTKKSVRAIAKREGIALRSEGKGSLPKHQREPVV